VILLTRFCKLLTRVATPSGGARASSASMARRHWWEAPMPAVVQGRQRGREVHPGQHGNICGANITHVRCDATHAGRSVVTAPRATANVMLWPTHCRCTHWFHCSSSSSRTELIRSEGRGANARNRLWSGGIAFLFAVVVSSISSYIMNWKFKVVIMRDYFLILIVFTVYFLAFPAIFFLILVFTLLCNMCAMFYGK